MEKANIDYDAVMKCVEESFDGDDQTMDDNHILKD
jgi:hypothetical protein